MSWKSLTTRKGRKPKSAMGPLKKVASAVANRVFSSRSELKQVIYQPVAYNLDNNAGTTVNVLQPVVGGNLQQGSGRNQRVADVIYVKSYTCSWTSMIRNMFTDATYRVIIYYDRQTQGTPILFTDLLCQGAAAEYSINTPYNVDTVGRGNRFRILHDKIYKHKLPFTATSATTDLDYKTVRIRKKYKGKGLKVQFYTNSALGGTAAIQQGQIGMLFIQGGNNNNCIQVRGQTNVVQFMDN